MFFLKIKFSHVFNHQTMDKFGFNYNELVNFYTNVTKTI